MYMCLLKEVFKEFLWWELISGIWSVIVIVFWYIKANVASCACVVFSSQDIVNRWGHFSLCVQDFCGKIQAEVKVCTKVYQLV